ncbi:MAG: carboxypeptidase-like regulatory domain-containing protein [Bacteroidetes bacterium]|nr:MAG: carboxypeptidase-like regulatory domain-containing protein [Bacteroidota bacterium]
MKKGLLGFSISFLLITSYGQEKTGGRITGKVMDTSLNVPLEYATITLLTQGKGTPLNGTTADTSGRFVLTNIPAGTFRIVIESLGYQPLHLGNITINQKHQVIDLKDVFLKRKQQTLQGVTVTAQQKLIENKIDKLVFNAEKDITSQTGVATDVVKKVPQV